MEATQHDDQGLLVRDQIVVPNRLSWIRVRMPSARMSAAAPRCARACTTRSSPATPIARFAKTQHWSRAEIERLIALARSHEPRFVPALVFLFSTGCRRGELLGLKWEDVDFERRTISIRRAITLGRVTTPKSGRGRTVAIPPALASELFDLLATRRQETLRRGWPQTPEWVFCDTNGTAWDARNFSRVWERLRRRAQREGIRPLKLHATRHTWATLALQAGKSVR